MEILDNDNEKEKQHRKSIGNLVISSVVQLQNPLRKIKRQKFFDLFLTTSITTVK